MARAVQQRARASNVLCAGSRENLRRSRDAVLHHAAGVLAHRVIDFWSWNAVAVLQDGIQGYAVVLLRKILARDTDLEATIEQFTINPMMVPAPREAARDHTGKGFIDRPSPAVELQRIASYEIPRRISLVKLLAPHHGLRATIAVKLVLDIGSHLRPRMQHQVFADQSRRIGQTVRKKGRSRVQKQPGCTDAVRSQDHHLRGLEPLDPSGIVIDNAGRHAVFAGGDLAHAATCSQMHPSTKRLW